MSRSRGCAEPFAVLPKTHTASMVMKVNSPRGVGRRPFTSVSRSWISLQYRSAVARFITVSPRQQSVGSRIPILGLGSVCRSSLVELAMHSVRRQGASSRTRLQPNSTHALRKTREFCTSVILQYARACARNHKSSNRPEASVRATTARPRPACSCCCLGHCQAVSPQLRARPNSPSRGAACSPRPARIRCLLHSDGPRPAKTMTSEHRSSTSLTS